MLRAFLYLLFAAQSSCWSFEIVGGTETRRDQYLFTVGLRSSKNATNFCAGALISPTHVLTAAHCVSDWDSSPSWVSIGSHFLSGESDGQYIAVKKRTVHPKYGKPISMSNDFAILELNQSVREGSPMIALADASGKNELVGQDSIVCGWGTTESGGTQSKVKLQVTVPIVSNKECLANVTGIDTTMLCAGLPQGGKDACQGDSGGPLFTLEPETKRPILIGIVSWGIGCARENLPGVYSRVSTALDFVQQHVSGVQFQKLR